MDTETPWAAFFDEMDLIAEVLGRRFQKEAAPLYAATGQTPRQLETGVSEIYLVEGKGHVRVRLSVSHATEDDAENEGFELF